MGSRIPKMSDDICPVDDAEEITGSTSDCGGSEEDIIV